jgi:hypothetical protein
MVKKVSTNNTEAGPRFHLAHPFSERSEPMNVEFLDKLINHLENLDNSENSKLGFDMRRLLSDAHMTNHPCGTACCILGHLDTMYDRVGFSTSFYSELSGLGEHIIDELFFPSSFVVPNYRHITLERAIAVLKNLKATGIVDWRLTG